MYKICGTCKKNKYISEFNFSNKNTGKLQSKCRDCQKEYRLLHIENYLIWKENNKDKIKTWYTSNKNSLKEKQKIYRKLNTKKIKQKKKIYYDNLFGTEKGIFDRFSRAKAQAKKRKIEFLLSFDEYKDKIFNQCYYCNFLLGKSVKTGSGLDRLDSYKGYVKENVVSCCFICNKIKSDVMTPLETKSVIDLLLKMRSLK